MLKTDSLGAQHVGGLGAWLAEGYAWSRLRNELFEIFREIAEATPTSKEGK